MNEIRKAKETKEYACIQEAMEFIDCIDGSQQTLYELNEYLEYRFGLSDMYVELQEIQQERIDWLKDLTNSKHVVNNDYYHYIAYNAIHRNTFNEVLLQLIQDNYENNGTMLVNL